MTIHYDRSESSTVISCSDCQHWRAIRFGRDEAYTSGEQHAINVHGVAPNVAANARRLWERKTRHAVT